MKNKLHCIVLWVILGVLSLVGLVVAVFILPFLPKQYVTTDHAKYGQYTGNYDNEFPKEFISSFFPNKLENYFSDVRYSYRAQKGDTYAFEAYLEFTINDLQQYEAYISKNIATEEKGSFRYNPNYFDYTIADEFFPIERSRTDNSQANAAVSIDYAKIGKILYCPDEQRIIYVALGVYDGGIARTDFLSVYFERFQIDPIEYAKYAAPAWDKRGQ